MIDWIYKPSGIIKQVTSVKYTTCQMSNSCCMARAEKPHMSNSTADKGPFLNIQKSHLAGQ